MDLVNQKKIDDVFSAIGKFIDDLLLEKGVLTTDGDYSQKRKDLEEQIEIKINEILFAHVPEEKRAELMQLAEKKDMSKIEDFLKDNKTPNLDSEVQQMIQIFRKDFLEK